MVDLCRQTNPTDRKDLPMSIIQQIAAELTEKVLETLMNDGLSDIGKTVKSFVPIVSGTVLKIVSAYLQEMDDALCVGAKAIRKQDGITVKERRVNRTILTELGELNYQRTYFRLKDGTFLYLLDQLIGVEEYERISKELIADLLNAATIKSYQKAIDATGQDISRQTIHNRLLALKELTVDVEPVEETPETLDLFADEGHAHLNPKGNAIVPLVTITEGMDISDPKRHKTIHPVHIAAYNMSQEAFNENVLAVLNQRYDLSRVKQINLHADGGNWILGLQRMIPKCRLVMDGYHLEKYLRAILHLDGASSYAGVIRQALSREDGYENLERYCIAIYERQISEANRQKVRSFLSYCASHWNAIVLRMKRETCGSCTESMVSHILSERLSRSPIAWSKGGLSRMTMLVVYTKNGCRVLADDVRVRPDDRSYPDFRSHGYSKYSMYAKQQADDAIKAYQNNDFFVPEHFSFGKVDGPYLIRKSLGHLRSLSELIA